VPPDVVAAQIDAVIEDIGAGAVKTGMLASAPIIAVVAERLRHHRVGALVVDPVMLAKSGDRLLHADAVQALRTYLLPLALLVTPNIPEAEVLADLQIVTEKDLAEAARCIAACGAQYVLIKGGHLPGTPIDRLWDGERMLEFRGERIESTSTHGTGCTLSAAITAHLARGASESGAVRLAKDYVTEAMRRAQAIGGGHGPLHHLWPLDGPL
jgi:hydroxymethylpyrimidine/phosphomethylpyrimidine kinase